MPRRPPTGYRPKRLTTDDLAFQRARATAWGMPADKAAAIYPEPERTMPTGAASTTVMGNKAEAWVMAELRREGYTCQRDSQSRGAFDLFAFGHGQARRIQVKSTLTFRAAAAVEGVKRILGRDGHRPWPHEANCTREVWLLQRGGTIGRPTFAVLAIVGLDVAGQPQTTGERAEEVHRAVLAAIG